MSDDINYEWNLYHDMDTRNYHDVNRIKELESQLDESIKEIKGAYEYLKSCGYLEVEQCEPEYQMTKSFEDFLNKMKKL